ncbi:MAG: aminopeptidase [Rudaea sp.]|uniref:aminopeptidase n=1 Tax=Rudaea sp. TaxID=2136325 RepID=UPI0039E451F0
MQPALRIVMAAILAILTSACSTLRYYAHVAHGQAQLVTQRKPVDAVIADPATDARLAARLRLAREARRFASARLGLPDNRSYTSYVDLHRPYVVWNVFAAPRYSVDPILHCFPIAGCVPYRGWFDEVMAKAEAARLEARGDDVYVGGVAAYSTLGRFADPILSTMLRWDDDELIGTIFHELAHQLIYVKDDTAFNESFANFVHDEGLREWHAARADDARDERNRQADDEFARLALDLRERLRKLYAGTLDRAAMEAAKQNEIADFRRRYAQWRDAHWPGDHRYDALVAAPINNASLLPFGLYDEWMPAFAALFAQAGRDWPAFHARVRRLARMQKTAREESLRAAAGAAAPQIPPSRRPNEKPLASRRPLSAKIGPCAR